MTVATREIGLESLDSLGVDALCLFVGQDERPLRGAAGFVDWRMCGGLSRVLEGGFFTGSAGEDLLVPSSGKLPSRRIFVVGLGPSGRLDAPGLGRALEHAAQVLSRARVSSVALELPGQDVLEDPVRAEQFRTRFSQGYSGQVTVLAPRPLAQLLG